MKILLSLCLLFVSSIALAGEVPAAKPQGAGVVKGVVLEVKNVSNFTYMRLKTDAGESWAAVINTPVKEGASVTIEDAVVMKNFESKALKRTFPAIIFGTLAGAGDKGANGATMGGMGMGGAGMMGSTGMGTGTAMSGHAASGSALGMAYPSIVNRKLETIKKDEPVAKAQGADAHTVAEVFQQAAELKDKTVAVRGKVVKYNPDIMGKNWVHLRDGTGSAADETNDLLVATTNKTRVGEVVTAKGVVRTNKDLGMGYTYKALIEEATLQ